MKNQLCPICYEILEVKDVTQCYVCGGWPGAVENFNSNSSFKEYYLDSGQKIVLCHSCWLDEILSLQGDLADDLKLPISGKTAGGIHFSRDIENPAIQKGKFCNNCNKTLQLTKIISEIN